MKSNENTVTRAQPIKQGGAFWFGQCYRENDFKEVLKVLKRHLIMSQRPRYLLS